MTSCVAFAALLQQNSRSSTGLRVSGVGGVVCARHECVRPNGVGDLQKGERYSNMDWIFFSAIMGVLLLYLTISYDIACQWKLHLARRMSRLPEKMQQNLDQMVLQFGLPVWHAESHTGDCREANSLRYKPGVGKTDGEGIERLWSRMNAAALASKEMSLGGRADNFDDRFDNHNWLKNNTLSDTLQRRLLVGRDERARQIEAFKVVSEGVHIDLQRQWTQQVRDWEADNSRPNPYVLPTKDFPTEAEIRLQLQKDERQRSIDGRAFIQGSSATSFVAAGIQIEDAQYRVREFKDEHSLLTADRETKLEEVRGSLLRKIARFRELQVIYMPGAASLIAAAEDRRDANAPPPAPEDIVLFMPSAVDPRASLPGLRETEECLRLSQCQNTISQLRFTLHGKRWLIGYRDAHVTGQRMSTKSVKLIEDVTQKAVRIGERYRRAYAALDMRLEATLQESDLDASRKLTTLGAGRGGRPSRAMPTASQSRRTMSWIWTAPGAFDDDEAQLHDSMRVEWTRALARKDRWNEEVMVLEEEMRRVMRYLDWKTKWWNEQTDRRPDLSEAVSGGIRAYALKRAAECERVMLHFRLKWALSERRTLQELVTLDSTENLLASMDASSLQNDSLFRREHTNTMAASTAAYFTRWMRFNWAAHRAVPRRVDCLISFDSDTRVIAPDRETFSWLRPYRAMGRRPLSPNSRVIQRKATRAAYEDKHIKARRAASRNRMALRVLISPLRTRAHISSSSKRSEIYNGDDAGVAALRKKTSQYNRTYYKSHRLTRAAKAVQHKTKKKKRDPVPDQGCATPKAAPAASPTASFSAPTPSPPAPGPGSRISSRDRLRKGEVPPAGSPFNSGSDSEHHVPTIFSTPPRKSSSASSRSNSSSPISFPSSSPTPVSYAGAQQGSRSGMMLGQSGAGLLQRLDIQRRGRTVQETSRAISYDRSAALGRVSTRRDASKEAKSPSASAPPSGVIMDNWVNEHRDFNRIKWDPKQGIIEGPCGLPGCPEESCPGCACICRGTDVWRKHWGGHHVRVQRGCIFKQNDWGNWQGNLITRA
ncbi:CxC2 domain-containing protein [Mycena kentingensis (nom. inval.)]|nr:CxC2 domain-containing protein [Mycena kentingensis (nom. inval.)]